MDFISQKAVDAGGRLRVKSALNPMLWLCAIVTIPGLLYMGLTSKDTPLLVQGVIFAPVLCAVLSFLFLLIFDRDKLQSEDYQIRKQTLELVQEKGDQFPSIAHTLEAISNPAINYLEHDDKEEDRQ